MIKYIKTLYIKILNWLSIRKKFYKIQHVFDIPKNPQPSHVYILGGTKNPFLAVILCPCGCGETLHMNLMNSRSPCWELYCDTENRPSLKPSLWKKSGCKSHFYLKSGEIKWVGDALGSNNSP